jgi:leucyl aminopeptidase
MDERQLRKLGMGGILAVGGGSIFSPPRLIVLEHRPGAGRRGANSTLLVVGKAITFDAGGISIKPAEKMGKMIFDKCGGMTVLGLMYAVAALRLPIHVVGILAAAENVISSRAYRPGDILRMFNGATVEVTNTDAEGRLVLADALAWGIGAYKPAAVVDLATLTGGVIVALGRNIAGIMSNDDHLVAELTRAADVSGEKLWRLPLGDEQREFIKSDCADIVNSAGREGHPLQGGAFLSYFVPENGSTPWAHLDIAGVADTEKELPYYAKGATGWGVRTLVQWVSGRCKFKEKR